MASYTKQICIFFLLTTLLSTLQTHARDTHFFSKVTRNRDDTAYNPNHNYYNNQHNVVTPFSNQQDELPYFNNKNYENFENNNNNNGGGGGNYGGVEKQGMSDTRYLENGKYFYDIKAEKKFYPTNNNDFSYNNNYNNNNNFNNNNELFYGDNNNYYGKNGKSQEYQNQFSENEFDFDDQP